MRGTGTEKAAPKRTGGNDAQLSQAARTGRPVVYPESDGKPMGETGRHVMELLRLIATLMAWYRDDPLVLVGGNQFLYYEEGNPRKSLAPDLYLTKGIAKEPPRNTYRLWVEGLPPTFVVEVTSPKTRREDQVKKRAIYEQIGVSEYVLYDPLGEYLRPALQAYRLGAAGYGPMQQDASGAFLSDALGLRLVLEAGQLQFEDRVSRRRLLSPTEQAELEREQARRAVERARFAAARANAEAERANAETERANVEAERANTQTERANAEAERADAEAMVRRTAEARVAELEALVRRLQSPSQ